MIDSKSISSVVAGMDHQVTVNALKLLEYAPGYQDECTGYKVAVLSCIDRPFSKLVKVRFSIGIESNTYYVKQFKLKSVGPAISKLQSRVKMEHAILSRCFKRLQNHGEIDRVRPVHYLPEDLILITEELRGMIFSDLLERSAAYFPPQETLDRLANYSRLCGKWLTHFQRIGAEDGKGTFRVKSMLDYIDIRLARLALAAHVGFHEEDRAVLLQQISNLIKLVPESDLSTCGIHADFCPGNCLATEKGIGVIDFAMYQSGSVFHDLAHFYHRVSILRHKPIYRRGVMRRFLNAFLEGYTGKAQPESPLFALFIIQHLVCHCDMIAGIRSPRQLERLFNNKILSTYTRQLRLWAREIPANRLLFLHYA